jgi:hypothetical protein
MTFSLLTASACNKPEIEDCRRACWNYNKVMVWDKVNQQVKDLPPEEAAVIRAQNELEFKEMQERAEDPGMLNCITNCQNDSSKEQVECLIEKTTATALESCLKL